MSKLLKVRVVDTQVIRIDDSIEDLTSSVCLDWKVVVSEELLKNKLMKMPIAKTCSSFGQSAKLAIAPRYGQ